VGGLEAPSRCPGSPPIVDNPERGWQPKVQSRIRSAIVARRVEVISPAFEPAIGSPTPAHTESYSGATFTIQRSRSGDGASSDRRHRGTPMKARARRKTGFFFDHPAPNKSPFNWRQFGGVSSSSAPPGEFDSEAAKQFQRVTYSRDTNNGLKNTRASRMRSWPAACRPAAPSTTCTTDTPSPWRPDRQGQALGFSPPTMVGGATRRSCRGCNYPNTASWIIEPILPGQRDDNTNRHHTSWFRAESARRTS